MKISYKKLWKLLIDRDMMKKDLAEKAGISNASIAKLGRNENVNTDILLKICVALKCDIEVVYLYHHHAVDFSISFQSKNPHSFLFPTAVSKLPSLFHEKIHYRKI